MDEVDYLCDRISIINKGKIVITDKPSTLKKSLGGDVVKILLENNIKEINVIIKKLNNVKSVKIEGSMVYLTVEHADKNIENIIMFLKKNNLKIKSITIKEPSLDDVFLNYTGENLENDE
jgi:ABC-2 type transport system ATP-binding protein